MKHGVIIPYDARLNSDNLGQIIKYIRKSKPEQIFCFVNHNRDVMFRSKLAALISKGHKNILIYDPSNASSNLIKEAVLFLIKEFDTDTIGLTGFNILESLAMHQELVCLIESRPNMKVIMGFRNRVSGKLRIRKSLFRRFISLLFIGMSKDKYCQATLFTDKSFPVLKQSEFQSRLLLNNRRVTNVAEFAGREMLTSVLMRPINDIFISLIIG